MKKFNTLLVAFLLLGFNFTADAQLCTGVKGPNLLGAKGTFSPPFITVNTKADACMANGQNSYSPVENIGNKLEGCSASTGDITPCSDYIYTDKRYGMEPEFTYTIIKTMGDENGSNCIHDPVWRAKDHTGDGGYFMAVNGAPSEAFSKLFYQVKRIPVCVGTTYEFAAWVINMMPGGSQAEAPNVSFVVNGQVIGTSGPIPYDHQWHQVGGQFTATTSFVDLEVINATTVAGGNDLGLDDISIRVCQSHIDVSGPQFSPIGSVVTPSYRVYDPLRQNNVYKFQFSPDGGSSWVDNSGIMYGTFGSDDTYTVNHPIFEGVHVSTDLNGYLFRLIVSTSIAGLDDPECIYFNDYHLIVVEAGSLPVELTSFTGTFNNGTANLAWTTSQEINSDRFELYRSYDGIDFALAITVKAAGNSSTTKKYNYADAVQKSSGYVYYKLKQIDKDGKFSFSDIVKLAINSVASKGLQLFPNPVVNNFTASFDAPNATKGNLIIRNAAGQMVFNKAIDVLRGSNSIVIENAPLSRGMYYISITGENINFNGKLQKQ